jgi:CHAT domain-containing protein
VALNNTVTGAGGLTVNAPGQTTLGGAVNVGSLATDAPGITQINANVTTTGDQSYGDKVTVINNTILSSGGSVKVNSIEGKASDISITAKNINIGDITTGGGNINFNGNQGGITIKNINTTGTQGGDVTLYSTTNILTGMINTSTEVGDAGNISLKASQDIQISSINTQSFGGKGGTVNAQTPGNIRIIDTIPGTNISIFTPGTQGGGDINLQYDGDLDLLPEERTPFIIGDASVNGAAGVITTGKSTINLGNNFYFTEQRGNIAIISVSSDLNSKNNPGNVVGEEVVPPSTPPPSSSTVISLVTTTETRSFLKDIESVTSQKPAVIYVTFKPRGLKTETKEIIAEQEATLSREYQVGLDIDNDNSQSSITAPLDDDLELDILLVTSEGEPIRIPVKGITRKKVVEEAQKLYLTASDSASGRVDYEPSARQLYQWLITPLEKTLTEQKINNLLFVMPPGLRIIPIAALIDSKGKFLVEKYSSGFAPSLSLNDNSYKDIKQQELLAVGASKFLDPNAIGPLPAVQTEIPAINKIWGGQKYLNEEFTINNLKNSLQTTPYGIVHIATHAEFKSDNRYIQFYDKQLNIDEIRSLGFNKVDLLVLSACRTAYGDENVELGFAGLAVQAGVKSALASLWWVGDTGTFAFMTDFYGNLKSQDVHTKAEAVRQTQIDMIQGRTRQEGGTILNSQGEVILPSDLTNTETSDLTHPYYWAPFTLIGNPW